ncbi:MAG: hypothetical protein FJX00_02300 [Alphaproteobacteria bacterium]|nr:hypothetical protein [Alphaproteobacteria bacterium]
MDRRVKNEASLKNIEGLNNYIKKAGNKAKRAKFISVNPQWLTGLKGWKNYLVQEAKNLEGKIFGLEGQKPTSKTKKALRDLKDTTQRLKKMINTVTPILEQSTNLTAPVVSDPKASISQQKQDKKREKKAALKAKKAEVASALRG